MHPSGCSRHRILIDWDAFHAAVEYYRTTGIRRKYIFENFEWLQGETRKYLEAKEKQMSVSLPTERDAK